MPEDVYKTEGGRDKAWRELSLSDPKRVAANSLASFDEATGVYSLEILGETYRVDPGKCEVANISNPARPFEYLLDLATPVYMTAARPIPPSGKLVKEFAGSEFFFRGSHTLPLDAVAEKFGKDRTGFEKACALELGGGHSPIGDCGCGFSAYPRVSMAFLLWLADEEFPARAGLLFDSNANLHMALDALWAVALVACQRLLKFRR